MTRKQLEALVWKHTHRDARDVDNGALARSAPVPVRTVLHYLPELGTCIVALRDLTLGELLDHLPRSVLAEIGFQLWRVVLGPDSRALGVFGHALLEEQRRCERRVQATGVLGRALLWAGPRPEVGSVVNFEAQSLVPY